MANYGITRMSSGGRTEDETPRTEVDPYAASYQPSTRESVNFSQETGASGSPARPSVFSGSGGPGVGGYGSTDVFADGPTQSQPSVQPTNGYGPTDVFGGQGYGPTDVFGGQPSTQDPYAVSATTPSNPYASVISGLQGMLNSDGSVAPTSEWASPPAMGEINNPFSTGLSQGEIEYYVGHPEEWQMRLSAQPWLQAGVNTAMEMDDRGYTRFQDDRNFQASRLDNDRGYGLDVNQQMMNAIQNGLYYGLDERGVTIDEGRLGLDRLTGDREYEIDQGRLALDQLTGDRDYDINQRLAGVKEQQVQINSQLANVEEMYKQGLISNDQAEIARKALRDQWEQTIAQGTLGFRGQELASLDAWRGTQAQLSREEMENAYRTAVMQAVGRNQAQNARFLRG